MGGGGERADVDEVQGKKGRRCLAFLAALPVHGDYESTRVHESNGGGTKNQRTELKVALVCTITKMQPQVWREGDKKKIHSSAKKQKKVNQSDRLAKALQGDTTGLE